MKEDAGALFFQLLPADLAGTPVLATVTEVQCCWLYNYSASSSALDAKLGPIPFLARPSPSTNKGLKHGGLFCFSVNVLFLILFSIFYSFIELHVELSHQLAVTTQPIRRYTLFMVSTGNYGWIQAHTPRHIQTL